MSMCRNLLRRGGIALLLWDYVAANAASKQ